MRLHFALLLLSLAGCSLVGDSDPFADPYLAVYDVRLDWIEDVPPVTGRIGLTYIGSDVVFEGDPCPGADGGYSERWELNDPNDRFPDGGGAVLGGVSCDGVTRYLFDGEIRGDDTDRGVQYVWRGRSLGRARSWARGTASAHTPRAPSPGNSFARQRSS